MSLLLLFLCPFFAIRAASAADPSPPDVPETGLDLGDAVRLTLENDPNIALSQAQLAGARGALLGAAGRFDPVLTSQVEQETSNTPLTEITSREEMSLQSSFGAAKEFRSGLSVSPSLGISRVDVPGAGDTAVNVGTLSFTVRQPLLQGRGRSVTAAGEMTAEREVAASGLDVEQTTAARVLTVVSQYWTARAQAINLEILLASETSSRELLDTTRRLVEADQTPAAELVQLEANLAAKESSRIGGERALFAARQDLGREIGLEPARIAALPVPADPFPEVRPKEVPPPAEAGRFIAMALRRRADLRAARERKSGAEILLRVADDALKPRLDLIFAPTWSGLVQGNGTGAYFGSLGRNVPGVGATLGFSLSWPTLNRAARGSQAETEAVRRQAELLIELVSRTVGADVPSALDAVRSSALQVEKASQAVDLFERAVANEEKKLRAGTSTLIDLISQRDRLTAARQAEVGARLALAQALVRLRFETGTLLTVEGGAGALRPELLISVPSVEETQP
ncbi:MAG TPA: TolC family protein [Thermoanaerobaculia bacterium]|nr:TolC family protein [Thermoanaerobaculia bacterium]